MLTCGRWEGQVAKEATSHLKSLAKASKSSILQNQGGKNVKVTEQKSPKSAISYILGQVQGNLWEEEPGTPVRHSPLEGVPQLSLEVAGTGRVWPSSGTFLLSKVR